MSNKLNNKQWRVNNLYKIIDKEKNLVTFKLNETQQEFEENRTEKNIILKARQLGFSTYECVDGLDDVLFNRNFKMVIIAHTKDDVKILFDKVRLAWEHFPEDLKNILGIKVNTDSANELSFGHGSSIRVALSTRSATVNRLHISEFGKICAKYPLKAEEIVTGAFPSVPDNGRIDIESTAESEFGYFHDMYWDAKAGKNEFKDHFFPWTNDDKYILPKQSLDIKDIQYQLKNNLTDEQISWYVNKKRTLKHKMLQEYPTTDREAFASSGTKLFGLDGVEKQHEFLKDPISTTREWKFYEEANPKHYYAMGIDVGEGIGGDSSACVVWDFFYKKPKVVATYKNNRISPDNLAYEVKYAGEKFNTCLVAPERNNHGHALIVKLKEIYPVDKIYKEIKKDEDLNRETEKLGWLTSMITKPKMLFDLSTAVEDELVEVVSEELLQEMRTYDKEDLSVLRTQEITKHWDLLIAGAIGFQMKENIDIMNTPIRPATKETYSDLYSAI